MVILVPTKPIPSNQDYGENPQPFLIISFVQIAHLIIKIVVKIISEQTIDQDGLTLKIIPKSRSSQPCMKPWSDCVQLVDDFVSSGVVKVAFCGNLIQGATVLCLEFCVDFTCTGY